MPGVVCVVAIERMKTILHREEMPEGSAMHVRQKMSAANCECGCALLLLQGEADSLASRIKSEVSSISVKHEGL